MSDYLLLTAVMLPLLFRRSRPLTARVIGLPEANVTSIALFLAVFSAGAHCHHRLRDLTRAGAVVASTAIVVWTMFDADAHVPGAVVAFQAFLLLLNTAFFLAGWLISPGIARRTSSSWRVGPTSWRSVDTSSPPRRLPTSG